MATDIQQRQEQAPAVPPPSTEVARIAGMVQYGLEKNLDAASIRVLGEMMREAREHDAKMEFVRDMMEFRKTCPDVLKLSKRDDAAGAAAQGRVGRSGVKYNYADFEDIDSVVGPHAAQFGMIYTFTEAVVGNVMTTTCVVRHRNGHVHESSCPMPTTSNNPGMTDQQKWAGSQTTGKRFALLNAFGLSTTDPSEHDEDKDDPTAISEEHATTLSQMMSEACKTDADRAKFYKYLSDASGRAIEKVADLRDTQFKLAAGALEAKLRDVRKGGAA